MTPKAPYLDPIGQMALSKVEQCWRAAHGPGLVSAHTRPAPRRSSSSGAAGARKQEY